MKEFFMEFWRDEEGATAIEYGLIAGLIAAVLVVVIGALGKELKEVFANITEAINERSPDAPAP